MSIKRTQREIDVGQAQIEFDAAFLALEKKYELTYGEMFEMLSMRLMRLSRNLVKDERSEE
jgi:hypothetical protein